MNRYLKFFLVWMSIILASVCYSHCAHAKEPKFKIAIMDTGYKDTVSNRPKLKLCKYGHYDFVNNRPGIGFEGDHGMMIADIIALQLETVDYCAVIYTVDKNEFNNTYQIISGLIRALDRAADENVIIANVSIVGTFPDQSEKDAIVRAGKRGVAVFVPAGNGDFDNRGINLDLNCNVFPACYQSISTMKVVGALTGSHRSSYSNYGKAVQLWESGTTLNSEKRLGTSFAVPRAVAKFILELNARLPQQTSMKTPSKISETHTTNIQASTNKSGF